MKIYEMLKLGGEMLKMMSEHDVMRDDYRFVPMVEEYQQMRHNRVKHMTAIKILAEEYGISCRTVERVMKRMKREC